MFYRESFRLGLPVALAILILDQASKWLILGIMSPPRLIEVTGFFNLTLAWNTGVSFSAFAGGGATVRWALIAIALLISAIIFVWMGRTERRTLILGFAGILGGALGNVIDRFIHGAVVDFLDFHLAGWHWPAFNLADTAITLGVVAILADGLFGSRRRG